MKGLTRVAIRFRDDTLGVESPQVMHHAESLHDRVCLGSREESMNRNEIFGQVEDAFGSVPGWMKDMPDHILDQYWSTLSWVLSDTELSARDKSLVAFGAASAIH
jgi:hypothetical protein